MGSRDNSLNAANNLTFHVRKLEKKEQTKWETAERMKPSQHKAILDVIPKAEKQKKKIKL